MLGNPDELVDPERREPLPPPMAAHHPSVIEYALPCVRFREACSRRDRQYLNLIARLSAVNRLRRRGRRFRNDPDSLDRLLFAKKVDEGEPRTSPIPSAKPAMKSSSAAPRE